MTKRDGKPCKQCGYFDYYNNGRCKVCDKRYKRSTKGVSTQNRYDRSTKGKARGRKYNKSNKGMSRYRNYTHSDRGKLSSTSHSAKRRARKAEAHGSYTSNEWRELCNHYGNRCLKCGSGGPLQADHIVALANGGANDITNIQPLCGSCNRSKGARHNTDYRGGNFITRWIQKKLF